MNPTNFALQISSMKKTTNECDRLSLCKIQNIFMLLGLMKIIKIFTWTIFSFMAGKTLCQRRIQAANYLFCW